MTRTIIGCITVNTPDMEYEYDNFPPNREVQAVIDEAALQHPSWTSMVIAIVNQEHRS